MRKDKPYYIWRADKTLEFVTETQNRVQQYILEKTGYTMNGVKSYVKTGVLFEQVYFVTRHLKWSVKDRGISQQEDTPRVGRVEVEKVETDNEIIFKWKE